MHAEILAAKHLIPGSPVCGQAYFVTDNHPLHLFEFMRPLIEGLGYKMPSSTFPYRPVIAFLRLWQFLHFRIGLPAPLFSPHEVRKLAISHCASSAEAERDFGYQPIASPDDAMEPLLDPLSGTISRGSGPPGAQVATPSIGRPSRYG